MLSLFSLFFVLSNMKPATETTTATTTEETKPVDSGDDQALKEKAETLEKTLHEREKQLQVYAMQNARLMDLLSQAQRFVSCSSMTNFTSSHFSQTHEKQ